MRAAFLFALPVGFTLLVGCSSSDDQPVADSAVDLDVGVDTKLPAEAAVDTALPGTPCEVSLTAWCTAHDCPDDVDKVPTVAWCASSTGVQRSTTACANFQIVSYTDPAGETQNVYYNSSTGVLSGWTKGKGDGESCVAGKTGFRFPSYTDCEWVFGPDLCKTFDAGTDSSPDAATVDAATSDATAADSD